MSAQYSEQLMHSLLRQCISAELQLLLLTGKYRKQHWELQNQYHGNIFPETSAAINELKEKGYIIIAVEQAEGSVASGFTD